MSHESLITKPYIILSMGEAKKNLPKNPKSVKECTPDGYVRLDSKSDTYLQQDCFIDQRDKDSWGFYDWPEYEITLYNNAGTYQVSMRILSKKFD